MKGSDVPVDFPDREQCFPDDDEVINRGQSCIIEPGGNIIAGPVMSENAIITADVDLQKVQSSRRSLDIAGHYNRPDIFKFQVNRQSQAAAVFEDDE